VPDQELCGILNVNKPGGMTSHDVVLRVRRMAGQRKVGHTGTLDPLATGVLLICLGQATRVSEYLVSGTKVYRALIRLGIATDTYDAEGEVTSRGPVVVTRAQLEHALQAFVGEHRQIPPAYSALKRGGVPLYKLARRDEAGRREAEDIAARDTRTVHIESVKLLKWTRPDLEIEVQCSKGTYIRSLAHELGEQLGCGAHLAGLTRTASGRFHIEQSIALGELEQAFASGQGPGLLLPMDAALQDFPATALDPVAAARVGTGQRIQLADPPLAGLCRAYTLGGRLAALLHRDADGWWRPHKVFLGRMDDESHS